MIRVSVAHVPNFLAKLPETSSSFAVGQEMPTMVLLEPRGLQLYLVSARGHRVYMGTGKRRMLSRTHGTMILTLDPGSGLW